MPRPLDVLLNRYPDFFFTGPDFPISGIKDSGIVFFSRDIISKNQRDFSACFSPFFNGNNESPLISPHLVKWEKKDPHLKEHFALLFSPTQREFLGIVVGVDAGLIEDNGRMVSLFKEHLGLELPMYYANRGEKSGGKKLARFKIIDSSLLVALLESETSLRQAEVELHAAQEILEENQKALEDNESQLSRLQEQVSFLINEIVAKDEQLAEQDKQLAEKEVMLNDMEQRIFELKAQLAAKDEQAATLTSRKRSRTSRELDQEPDERPSKKAKSTPKKIVFSKERLFDLNCEEGLRNALCNICHCLQQNNFLALLDVINTLEEIDKTYRQNLSPGSKNQELISYVTSIIAVIVLICLQVDGVFEHSPELFGKLRNALETHGHYLLAPYYVAFHGVLSGQTFYKTLYAAHGSYFESSQTVEVFFQQKPESDKPDPRGVAYCFSESLREALGPPGTNHFSVSEEWIISMQSRIVGELSKADYLFTDFDVYLYFFFMRKAFEEIFLEYHSEKYVTLKYVTFNDEAKNSLEPSLKRFYEWIVSQQDDLYASFTSQYAVAAAAPVPFTPPQYQNGRLKRGSACNAALLFGRGWSGDDDVSCLNFYPNCPGS